MIYIHNNSKKSGAFGEYHKYFSNLGVKVIYETKNEYLNNLYYCLNNKESLNVIIESTLFNIFHGGDVSCVEICKKKDEYFFAIKMPHFFGKPLTQPLKHYFLDKKGCITKKTTPYPLVKRLFDKLYKKGMVNHDLHNENVLSFQGEVRLIDFSPDLIQYFGSKKEFQKYLNTVLSKLEKSIKLDLGKKINRNIVKSKIMKIIFK